MFADVTPDICLNLSALDGLTCVLPPPRSATGLRIVCVCGGGGISPTTEKKIREELMVFLCHYRNKLIFDGGGDSLELEQHDVSGDVSRGMAQ